MTAPKTIHMEPMSMGWRDQAACLGSDVDAFFRSEGTRNRAREASLTTARRICHTCPVAIACLVEAVRMGDDLHGVRGGLDMTDDDDRATARAIAATHQEVTA